MRLEDIIETDLEKIEDAENEISVVENDLEEVNQRIETIEQAIANLEGDESIASSVESNLEMAEADREKVLLRKEELETMVADLSADLEEMAESNEQSERAIKPLIAIGEDMSSAMAIISSRRAEIENAKQKISAMSGRLTRLS